MLVGISGVAMALVAERAEDIPLLASLFLRRVASMTRLSPDASAWLAQRDWPGNVRGLRAMVEAAAALPTQGSDTIDAALLRFVAGTADDAAPPSAALSGALAAVIADLETRTLLEALAAAHGNQSEAARKLGISGGTDQEDGATWTGTAVTAVVGWIAILSMRSIWLLPRPVRWR